MLKLSATVVSEFDTSLYHGGFLRLALLAAVTLAVAVHPETLAQLGPEFDKLLASPDLPEQTHVEPDESVDPAGVVVRQRGGSIDAGLRAQLDRLQELLT